MYELKLKKIERKLLSGVLADAIKAAYEKGKISGIGVSALSDENFEWWDLEKAAGEMPYDYKKMASALMIARRGRYVQDSQVRSLLKILARDTAHEKLIAEIKKNVVEQGYKDLIEPKVGMPATYYVGTDRYGGVITFVKGKGREIGFQTVDRHRTDNNGQSEDQSWEHDLSKPDARREKIFTRRQDGYYRPKGEQYRGACFLRIGILDSYKDPSF